MNLVLADGRSVKSASNRRYALVVAYNDEAAFVAKRSNSLDALASARQAARRKAHAANVSIASAIFDLLDGSVVS